MPFSTKDRHQVLLARFVLTAMAQAKSMALEDSKRPFGCDDPTLDMIDALRAAGVTDEPSLSYDYVDALWQGLPEFLLNLVDADASGCCDCEDCNPTGAVSLDATGGSLG